ncbi:MAG TPA: hypothetical protein VLV83_21365 [Acidobacteriota bacterium]|nr:hypothetical protein [Acidobacteriota bacterium]
MVPPEKIFESQDGLRRSELVIGYFFFGKEKKRDRMWSFWDKIDLDLKPQVYQDITSQGLDFQKRLDIPASPRDLEVRIVVYNPQNDLLGSSNMVKIE